MYAIAGKIIEKNNGSKPFLAELCPRNLNKRIDTKMTVSFQPIEILITTAEHSPGGLTRADIIPAG